MVNKNNTGMHKTTLDDHQPPASSWSKLLQILQACVTPQPPQLVPKVTMFVTYALTDSLQVKQD